MDTFPDLGSLSDQELKELINSDDGQPSPAPDAAPVQAESEPAL